MLLSWNKNYYENTLGMKTGFTTPAGYCLVSYAQKDGLDLSKISVVISEELPQKNGEKLYSTMMVPSSAGLSIAKFILESIIIEK